MKESHRTLYIKSTRKKKACQEQTLRFVKKICDNVNMAKKKNQYGKKSQDGFRSRFESRIAAWLKKIGLSFLYEPIKIPYVVPEKHRTYTPDFIIDPNNRRRIKNVHTLKDLEGKIIIETKGRLTTSDRNKMLYVKKANPSLDIRFIFMYDNFIRKGSNTRYSDWCEKHGFEYYIGEDIPKSWFK